ncbi:hypothetical protein NUU61_002588 [Penicillium alfredii]|uniref:Uncharacterized protein n=1 Tax=Penicillium alfredii TaxID=1506179 RepID=A0A9W9KGR6_9EURO|nr:uncharacterized protein NUU61_002588 [Penicillium alfredii]KAJ5105241.1 hypothetical protein NUU61_002588 [Penicillium alfredii]
MSKHYVNIFFDPGHRQFDNVMLMRAAILSIDTGLATIGIYSMGDILSLCFSIRIPGEFINTNASFNMARSIVGNLEIQARHRGMASIDRAQFFR